MDVGRDVMGRIHFHPLDKALYYRKTGRKSRMNNASNDCRDDMMITLKVLEVMLIYKRTLMERMPWMTFRLSRSKFP